MSDVIFIIYDRNATSVSFAQNLQVLGKSYTHKSLDALRSLSLYLRTTWDPVKNEVTVPHPHSDSVVMRWGILKKYQKWLQKPVAHKVKPYPR